MLKKKVKFRSNIEDLKKSMIKIQIKSQYLI